MMNNTTKYFAINSQGRPIKVQTTYKVYSERVQPKRLDSSYSYQNGRMKDLCLLQVVCNHCSMNVTGISPWRGEYPDLCMGFRVTAFDFLTCMLCCFNLSNQPKANARKKLNLVNKIVHINIPWCSQKIMSKPLWLYPPQTIRWAKCLRTVNTINLAIPLLTHFCIMNWMKPKCSITTFSHGDDANLKQIHQSRVQSILPNSSTSSPHQPPS